MIEHEKALTQALEKLETFEASIENNSSDTVNRLFFAARNGAISHLLRSFEHHFHTLGFDVRASWEESSFPGVCVVLIAHDKRTGHHTRRLHLERTSPGKPNSLPSDLVYALSSVQVGEYYPHRKPKVAERLDDELASESFHKMAAELIDGANYPFVYTSHSSF